METLKEENIDEFGQRLKNIRKSLELKQRDFASDLNISVTTLSDIETGKSKPGHDFFVRICETYKVNLYYLLFGEGEMFRKESEASPVESLVDEAASEDVRDFLTYFFNSKLVQYQVLGYFRKFFNEEEAAINKDVEKTSRNY